MDTLSFDQYQNFTNTTAQYPNSTEPGGLTDMPPYVLYGLAGEVGETLEKFKKVVRGDYDNLSEEDWTIKRNQLVLDLEKELGDIMWYVAQAAYHLGLPLSHVINMNVEKLSKRKTEGTIKGNGDNR